MAFYSIDIVASGRHEAAAAHINAGIYIKLFGTVADSEFCQIGLLDQGEHDHGVRWMTGHSRFAIETDDYLGDIYRIALSNDMHKDSNFPDPDLFVDTVYITNPDPLHPDDLGNVTSRFVVHQWVNEKRKIYEFPVTSGLDLEGVKRISETMVYGSEFSVVPGASIVKKIVRVEESTISEVSTSIRSTQKSLSYSVNLKPAILELFPVTFFTNGSRDESTEEKKESSEEQNEGQTKTWSATITNKQDRVRTFKPAYIIRKNIRTMNIGYLSIDNAYAEERIFAGFMETTAEDTEG